MCRHYHRRGGWFFMKFFFGIAALAVVSLILMLIWNAVVPEVFGLRSLGYLQAVGIFILSKILFTGIHRRGWGHYSYYGYRHRGPWHEKKEDQKIKEDQGSQED